MGEIVGDTATNQTTCYELVVANSVREISRYEGLIFTSNLMQCILHVPTMEDQEYGHIQIMHFPVYDAALVNSSLSDVCVVLA